MDKIDDELNRIMNEPCSKQEMDKAIRQFEVSEMQSRETMQGRAQDLASNWALAGDLEFSERCLEKAKSLTPDKILETAQRWLQPNARTLYTLSPESQPSASVSQSQASQRSPIIKRRLSNGWTALFLPENRLPFVHVQAVFHGGLLTETSANNGISGLFARSWMKGSKRRSGEQIAEELESMGASLSPYAGSNSVGLSMEVLATDLEAGLDLFWDTLMEPAFPESEVNRERQIQINQALSRKDQILQVGMDAFRVAMFGAHPYSMNRLGDEKSLSQVTSEDLKNYHQNHIVGAPATLAVFGSMDPDQTLEELDRRVASLPASDLVHPFQEIADPIFPNQHQRAHAPWDKSQAACILGFPGAKIDSEDRWALGLLDAACSDMGSRIFLKIRDELGLAYYCGATNLLGLAPGYFAFYVGTAKESLARVEEELWNEITRLSTTPFSEEELARIKAKVIGQIKIGRQSLEDEALASALDELYGLGFDNRDRDLEKFQAITPQEIQDVAARYLVRDRSVMTLISA